jgi:AcrR family transcriptional regulator
MPARGSSVKSDQRRQVVLDAAVACFARKGFYGTTTHEIAERAGISQPYLYRLFANKQSLFAHAVQHVSEVMARTLATQAAAPFRTTEEALHAARAAYSVLIKDRDIMMFLMHANCVADEPLVVDAVRACYAKQVELVRELLGDDDEAIRRWFGAGMVDNVSATLRLAEIDEPWARTLRGQ